MNAATSSQKAKIKKKLKGRIKADLFNAILLKVLKKRFLNVIFSSLSFYLFLFFPLFPLGVVRGGGSGIRIEFDLTHNDKAKLLDHPQFSK